MKPDDPNPSTRTDPPSPIAVWVLAARPKTLPAAVGPVLVGSALAGADGVFRPLPAAAALLVALLMQVGVNLANDYFDGMRGIDSEERLGPARATQSGWLAPRAVRTAMIAVFALAALAGAGLAAVGGWPVFVVGVAAIISALAYSGGPYPLASNGLADLFVFIFFGPVAVCGTYYVHALTLSPLALPASIPMGLLITAILVVNNLRDIPTDRKTGKITLAVLMGPVNSRVFYTVLVALAYPVPAIFLAAGYGGWVLLPLATLPFALYWIRGVWTHTGRPLNRILAGTAMLSLFYGLFFAAGLLLS